MLAFAMISQRRILSLIHLFTAQGVALVAATLVVGYATQQPHLYLSAGITLVLKVILIPLLLHRVMQSSRRALGRRDADQHPDDHDHRHRAGHFRFRPGAANLQTVGQRRPRPHSVLRSPVCCSRS
jgi:hypothetical protein